MQYGSRLTAGDTTAELVASVASDVGSVRRINEDNFLVSSSIFLVADGMGGHDAGDQASAAVRATFESAVADGEPVAPRAVIQAIQHANDAVRLIGDRSGDRLSGTTLAGVALVDSGSGLQWMAFNIGDSRIYQWTDDTLTQLSVDHSAVQELIDGGSITRLEATTHPDRNVITRAIGAADIVDADVWLIPLAGTQCFLLCSDGLSKELDDEQISRILSGSHPGEVAAELVAAAVEAGGADNVTAVVVQSRSLAALGDLENTNERADLTATRIFEDTIPRN